MYPASSRGPAGRARVQVEQRHAGAAGRETADNRQADARGAACHNCHSGQLLSSFITPARMVPP